jgi:hypothetical protein
MNRLQTHLIFSTWLLPSVAFAQGFPIAPPGTEGMRIVVQQTGEVTATYRGNSAWNDNTLYLALTANGTSGNDGNLSNDLRLFNNGGRYGNAPGATAIGTTISLGTFAAGTELLFRLNTIAWQNSNNVLDFYSGSAALNPDGRIHTRVQSEWRPGTTLVSFEDLYNGPFNFNDMSFSFTNTMAAPVPEESTLVLTMLGLLAGWYRYKRQNNSLAREAVFAGGTNS